MEKTIICTVCPRGCSVIVEGDNNGVKSVNGYGCKRGLEYATAEFTNPCRILTTLVKINGDENSVLPVRSNKPISKDKIFDCMQVIKKASVNLPVKMHQVIIKNILETGVDIVATKEIK